MDSNPISRDAILNWRKSLGAPRPAEDDEETATPLPMRVSQLSRLKAQDDKRSLLGERFLCAGGALLITGETGVGKSSLIAQMAISFSIGAEFFGIKPRGLLKSMIIQAENDAGDIAEEVQGVINGLGVADREDEIDQGVLFFEETIATGEQFADRLAALLSKYPCDLVFVDPLLAFLGGDVNRQDVVSKFLRNQINPILKRTGAAMVLTHHVGKPSQNPAFKRSNVYGGIGTSDIQNWARAIMAVNDAGDGTFELVASKRGNRSGIPGGRTFIKHATKGIFWEQSEAPTLRVNEAQNEDTQAVIAKLRERGPTRSTDLRQMIMDREDCSVETAKRRIADWKKRGVVQQNEENMYYVMCYRSKLG